MLICSISKPRIIRKAFQKKWGLRNSINKKIIKADKNNVEKISIRKIINNTLYVLKYAMKTDKKLVLGYIIGYSLFMIGMSLFRTIFLKMVIDQLIDNTPLVNLLIFILFGFTGIVFLMIIEAGLMELAEIQLVKATGKIQKDFIIKCSKIDIICYDHPDYFDDFVIAASQSEEMIKQAITCFANIIGNSLAILFVGAFVFTINPIIAIFPVLGFIVNIITRFAITKLEYNYEMDKKKVRRKADYSKRVFYQPEYAKEIKLSNIEAPLLAQFNEAIEEERELAKKYGVKIAVLSLINWIVVFTFLSFICVPLYLGYLALVKFSIALGDVASLNNATNIIRNNLDATNYALVEFQKVGQYAERFRRFLQYEVKIEDFVGNIKVPEGKQDIQIENLSFKYDGSEKYSLKDINMRIRAGEKIAIVGENGAGKTTFVKLLMRLYDVTEGSVFFGDNNICDYTTREYRDVIGAVFQDYQIYAATLGENVLMDFVEAEDTDRILNALELADFSEKLAKLPKGIDTEMTREFSDEGTMLSGGESQKVAIARLFAKKQKLAIAILDEPSSALDPIAEYTLNSNMMESAKEATIIFISHRLSTTRSADRIYMFEEGKIVEQGTHEELMELKGQYHQMFEKQAYYYKLGNIS